MPLQAFHNDPKLKADLLVEVEKHRRADAIVAGTYEEYRADGQFIGCAVGCSIESLNRLRGRHFKKSNHAAYPKLVGVPEWLAQLQDAIFEDMPAERRAKWPGQFWKAIRPGADLESVKAPFLIYILKQTLTNVDCSKFPEVKEAVHRVIKLHRTGGSRKEFLKAGDDADKAISSLRGADSTIDWADLSNAEDVAHTASYAALAFAGYTSYIDTAVFRAACCADIPYAAAYSKFADKLLKLMAAA